MAWGNSLSPAVFLLPFGCEPIYPICLRLRSFLHLLPHQAGEAELRILPTGVRQMLRDQFTEPQPLVEFAHQDQAAIRRNVRTLKAGPEKRIEGKLEHPRSHHTR